MFGHKYTLDSIEELGRHNPLHETILGKVCFLSYFRRKERGCFLVDTEDEFGFLPHRIITLPVVYVSVTDDEGVIVETEDTRYTFAVIE